MKIAKESVIIAVLGTIDLITTIVFIQHHGAEEANPIFRFLWNIGLPAFIAAKVLLTACPLLVLEWARQRNPRFVQVGMRSAIAGYLMMYGVGYLHLNGPGADQRDIMAAQVAYATSYSQETLPPQEDTRTIEERERQESLDRQKLLNTFSEMLKRGQSGHGHRKSEQEASRAVLIHSARLYKAGD